MSRILMPKVMRIGARASLALPEALASIGCSRPLLVTDKFMVSSGLLAPLQSTLVDAGMSSIIFDGVVPEPTTESLDAGVAMATGASCDANSLGPPSASSGDRRRAA